MRKRTRGLTALGLIGVAMGITGAFYGYAYWGEERFNERTDNAYIRSAIVAVAPRVAGHVVELAVTDNQQVEAGDVLFRIDPADFEARLAQSVAALSATQAARRSLDEERTLQGALINEAQAGLRAAIAEADRVSEDRERSSRLVAGGWTSRQGHDAAIAAETRAHASVEQAQAGLAAQRQRLNVLIAEAARLDALINQAAAQVRLAEIALEDSVVRAPIPGVVGNRHVEVGHYARAGTPLLSIVPLHDVWVVANFRETQLERMRQGQAVTVQVSTFGGLELSGHVDSFAPASGAEFSLLPPDNATGNFVRIVQRIPIKIVLDSQNGVTGVLRPGMSAEVVVDTRPTHRHPSAAR